MFSKTELEFLKGKLKVSETYARLLRLRINKKVESLREVIPILTANGYQIPYVTENSNVVTEFSNASLRNPSFHQSENNLKNNSISPDTFSVNAFPKRVGWRRERDSNPHRP